MFKPVAMMRLSLVILERDVRSVLRYLGRAGVAELTQAAAGPDTAPLPPRDLDNEIERVNRLLNRLENLRRALPSVFAPRCLEVNELSLEQIERQLDEWEQQSGAWLNRRAKLQQSLAELTAAATQMAGYCGAELPLDRPEESSFLHFVTGSLPAKNFAKLEIGADVAVLPLTEQNGTLCLAAVTTRSHRKELEQRLRRAGFQLASLPAVADATVDSALARNQREQKTIADKLAQLDAKLQTLAENLAPVSAPMETLVANEKQLLEVLQNFPRTESAVLVTGWIPLASVNELTQRIREITRNACLIDGTPAEATTEAEIPVLLRHPYWLRPFGKFVTAYGLPSYQELEPTLFVAASFVLMFGMMFGDVGHGALIAIAGLLALTAGKRSKFRDAGPLLVAGGISSLIFGALYGSFFGLESFKPLALWRDPLTGDPAHLMLAAIGVGLVVISLGLVLNIINCFRRRDFVGGWLDRFGVAGLVFYWGSLGLLAELSAIQSLNLLVPVLVVFLGLPITGWILKDPLKFLRNRWAGRATAPDEDWFAVMTESLVGAFEALLSFLANTISFVRLAAYAMSHAALLLAALMLADALKHLPAGGTFLSVLVIILGNIAAMLLEGVIACVQALRLEYYEFFSKFFPGGGRPFKPFRLRDTVLANSPN